MRGGKMWGPAAATAHNTHCGRGWINSSEDGTWWCNPQPRIMEHRNLKDNTLSEQWAQEPQRGRGERNRDCRHFHCTALSNILRQQSAETHSGFILTENEAVCGEEGKGRPGVNTAVKAAEVLLLSRERARWSVTDPWGGHETHCTVFHLHFMRQWMH